MKKLLAGILVAILAIPLLFTSPALADGDAAAGSSIFSANCAACHMGGGNVVNPAKTLQSADLEANGMADLTAIETQVTNGKNAMPSFSGKLSEQDIEDVATYVLSQADGGW